MKLKFSVYCKELKTKAYAARRLTILNSKDKAYVADVLYSVYYTVAYHIQ